MQLIRGARCLAAAIASAIYVCNVVSAQEGPAVTRSSRVLAVPSQYGTIQLAIDSARRGDTVLVARGRYYENIRFKGRGIVLTSQFARTRDLADIEQTIIDGSRPRHADTASVVMFVNQEDSMAVLQGFTITGGKGTVWLDAKDHAYFREGGGILCELSSPTIRFNYIIDNEAIAKREGLISAVAAAFAAATRSPPSRTM
jgi:hypothetical protein